MSADQENEIKRMWVGGWRKMSLMMGVKKASVVKGKSRHLKLSSEFHTIAECAYAQV